MGDYKPIMVEDWGDEIDYNFFPDSLSLAMAQKQGLDQHSAYGDPLFVDPSSGDFRVQENSPALAVGFENFPMNFGVVSPRLKSKAQTPEIPVLFMAGQNWENRPEIVDLLGATIKSVETLGEHSAAGLGKPAGVLVLEVVQGSPAAKSGLKERDVILQSYEDEIVDVPSLLNSYQGNKWRGALDLKTMRNQSLMDVELKTSE